MNCPFCQHANAATARACRVCGGPLRATKPKIAVTPTPTPLELARQTFDKNASPLINASFLPGENPMVCLVRENGVVQLWNAEADEISSFSIGRLFRKFSPICCALSASSFVATGHEDGQIKWHQFDGCKLKSPASHAGRVLALAANATHFYSGGSDGVIWATTLGAKKIKSCALIEILGALATFAVSPDATLIAVGCDDGAVQLWRANAENAAAKLDWTRRKHEAPIASLSFSPDGQSLVSRDKSGALCLWAAQTSYQLPLSDGVQCSHAAPAFSGDSRLLAVNGTDGVAVFDVALGTLVCEIAPVNEEITHLAFATGATWLLLAGGREIAVWQIS